MANTYKIMSDGSKQPFFTAGSASESGTSDYNQLSNRPIVNVSGNPVVLSTLPTGIYKVTGSWSLIENSTVTPGNNDDLFFVENTDEVYKTTILQASDITSVECPVDGTEADIVSDSVAKESTLSEQLADSAWGVF